MKLHLSKIYFCEALRLRSHVWTNNAKQQIRQHNRMDKRIKKKAMHPTSKEGNGVTSGLMLRYADPMSQDFAISKCS